MPTGTIYANIHGENKVVSHYGIDTATGDRGLFVYDIDEQATQLKLVLLAGAETELLLDLVGKVF